MSTRSPLQAFDEAPAPEPRRIQLSDGAALPAFRQPESLDPTHEVTIDIAGYGSFQSSYHDVVVGPGWVVLAWDKRCKGTRFTPPSGEKPPRMAIAIGDGKAHMVESTGIMIPFREMELCLLLIAKSHPIDPGEEAAVVPDDPEEGQ